MNETPRSKRHRRLRSKVKGTALRPRLSVFRSNRALTVQFIDDEKQQTLVGVDSGSKGKTKTEQAHAVGVAAAQAAKKVGITQVVFDRSGYRYHGRVKVVAEALREGGLKL